VTAFARRLRPDKLQTGAIVDFGTAVIVDLVDDDGVLVGGAIAAPGSAMNTLPLPLVEPGIPELPYGRTLPAIQTGVCRGMPGRPGIGRGHATQLNCWPQVIATGGV
jgi:pantothenate kinase type III